MKRRGFLGSVVGSLAGGSILRAESARVEISSLPSDGPLMTTPAVHMAPRADGLEVVWAVSRLARGWVEWKDEGGNAGEAHENAFGFVPQGDRVVRVRIGGMKAGARYRLRAVTQAGDGSGVREEGPWKDFRTLDGKAATTRFVVWNDTHENEETIRLLQAATPPGDFMLWNGDTCNDWTRPDLLAPTLLNPAGQDISNGRPLLVNWGNHDSRGAWAFQMPEFVATPDNRPYYAFRSGPVFSSTPARRSPTRTRISRDGSRSRPCAPTRRNGLRKSLPGRSSGTRLTGWCSATSPYAGKTRRLPTTPMAARMFSAKGTAMPGMRLS